MDDVLHTGLQDAWELSLVLFWFAMVVSGYYRTLTGGTAWAFWLSVVAGLPHGVLHVWRFLT